MADRSLPGGRNGGRLSQYSDRGPVPRAGSPALCIPIVVSAVTPLVDHGPQVQALASQYPSEIATVSAIDPATLNTLNADPTNSAAIAKAVREVSQARDVTPAAALNQLVAVSKVPKQDLQYLQTYGPTVQQAQQDVPGQWQTWWWSAWGARSRSSRSCS